MSLPAATPATLLADAARGDSARVLLTFYDDATGERAELSVATFANWVAKTANLCRDDLGLDVGARVAIALPAALAGGGVVAGLLAERLRGLPRPRQATCRPTCDVVVLAMVREPEAAAVAAVAAAAHGDVVGLGLGPMGLPVRRFGRARRP